jgi:prepilin-type N-terminal cleavage/methylation domain-containing protein
MNFYERVSVLNDSEGTKKAGFSLAELLVVVAIIAVLIAVSIPIFTALTAKARASTDMANIRSAKAAASVSYLSSQSSEEVTYYYDADNGRVTTSKTTSAAFKGYGRSDVVVKGASGYPVRDGDPQILAVKFSADGTCTASWGLGSDTDDLVTKALAYISSKKGYYSGNDLIKAMGRLPSVAASDIFGSARLYGGETTLYWRPKEIKVNGTKTVFLYAGGSSSGAYNWQGYAIYYNGTTYRSTNMNGKLVNRNSVGIPSFSSEADLTSYLLSNKWEAVR